MRLKLNNVAQVSNVRPPPGARVVNSTMATIGRAKNRPITPTTAHRKLACLRRRVACRLMSRATWSYVVRERGRGPCPHRGWRPCPAPCPCRRSLTEDHLGAERAADLQRDDG